MGWHASQGARRSMVVNDSSAVVYFSHDTKRLNNWFDNEYFRSASVPSQPTGFSFLHQWLSLGGNLPLTSFTCTATTPRVTLGVPRPTLLIQALSGVFSIRLNLTPSLMANTGFDRFMQVWVMYFLTVVYSTSLLRPTISYSVAFS